MINHKLYIYIYINTVDGDRDGDLMPLVTVKLLTLECGLKLPKIEPVYCSE